MIDSYETFKLKEKAYGCGEKEEIKEKVEDRIIDSVDKFIKFCENGSKKDQNGAVVVFTGDQFVFLRNDNGGAKGHYYAFADAYMAMEGTSGELDFEGTRRYISYRKQYYLRIAIECESWKNVKMYKWVRFFKDFESISPSELASFQAFYDIFGEAIDKKGFGIWVNDNSNNKSFECSSMSGLLEYLKTQCNPNKEAYVSPKGERIVGCPNGLDKSKTLS